jgi:hypothetical protein
MLQSGLLSGYALMIVIGVLVFLGYYGLHVRSMGH